MEKAQKAVLKKPSPPKAPTADPLPELVQRRFRLLKECADCGDRNDTQVIQRRLDEVQRRARKLDERIVRTVATSTSGLLAQVRLLAAFYEESLNGAGRRGSLLIQSITAGIERLDRLNHPRPLSDCRNTRHPKIRHHRNSVLGDEEDRGDGNTKRVRPTKVSEIGSDAPVEPEDLFEVANLYPSTTGLPMTVWVSPRGNAEHDVRVRVNITGGNQLQSPSDGKPTVGVDGGDLRRANRDGSISPLWC